MGKARTTDPTTGQSSRITDTSPGYGGRLAIIETTQATFINALRECNRLIAAIDGHAASIVESKAALAEAKESLDIIRYRLVLETDFDKILGKRTNEAERTAHLTMMMISRDDANRWKDEVLELEETLEKERRGMEVDGMRLKVQIEILRYSTATLEALSAK